MKVAAALAVLAGLAFAQDETPDSKSFKGKTPPELEIEAKNWINSKDAIKLSALKGRVVWLEFSFLA